MRLKSTLVITIIIGLIVTSKALAGTDQPPGGSAAPADLWHRKYLSGDWDRNRDRLENLGVEISIQETAEYFGNPYGGNFGRGGAFDGQLYTGATIDLEKLSGGNWPQATFHMNTYWIHGENLTEKYVGDYSGLSNINAYNTFRLDELWLQQGLFGTNSYFKVGMAGVDSDFVLSNSSGLFINSTFGAFPFMSFNFQKYNPPIYPLDSPTLLLHLVPTSSIYL